MSARNSHSALPSLDLLKGFEAAARHASFTRAASELFVTQSAISRQIKTLEEQLGAPLFKRNGRELRLTAAGDALYKAAAEALGLLRAAISQAHAKSRKVLTITTTEGLAQMWLVPRIGQFTSAHPDVDVRISATRALKDMNRDEIDVAIRYGAPGKIGGGATRLFSEQIFPVCGKGLLAKHELKSPHDLSGHVLLHIDDKDARWPWLTWNAWLAGAGANGMKPSGTMQFSQYCQLIQAAVGGKGIGLGRTPLVDGLLKEGALVRPFGRRFVFSSPDAYGYFVIVSPKARARPEVEHFLCWIRKQTGAGSARRSRPRATGTSPP